MLDEIIEVKRYKTSDGREFDTKKEAELHVETVIKMLPAYRREVIKRQKMIEDREERKQDLLDDLKELKDAFNDSSKYQKELKNKIAHYNQINKFDDVKILTLNFNIGCSRINDLMTEIVKVKKQINSFYPINYYRC